MTGAGRPLEVAGSWTIATEAGLTATSVRLLGRVCVTRGGSELAAFGSGPLLRLLTCLVLRAGAPVSRAELAFRLWPDSSEPQARTSLRMALHQLSQELDETERFVEITNSTLRWLQVIEAHTERGDRASAISAYHRCAELLSVELGVEPAAETQALYQRITRVATQVVSPPRPAPLVGREAEWAILEHLWHRAIVLRASTVAVRVVLGVNCRASRFRLARVVGARRCNPSCRLRGRDRSSIVPTRREWSFEIPVALVRVTG